MMIQPTDISGYMATAKNGIVTASHPLAAQAGLSILRKGGSAVDAAVATALALTVVEPCMASIAGRGEVNIYLADPGKVYNIEFVAVCGEKAKEDSYEVLPRTQGAWWTVKDDANSTGYRSICVPTALAGLATVLEKHGTMEFKEITEPSIELASKGFEVDAKLENNIDTEYPRLARFPATAHILCPRGRPLMRGETLHMRDYAQTLRSIATDGPETFYEGNIAETMIRELDKNGGLITRKDLEAYKPNQSNPLRTTYRGYEIVSGSPSCSGGRLVLQSLNILENFDLTAYNENSPELIHVIAETFKLCFADRLQYEADPNFTKIPAVGMLSKQYARELKSRITMDKAEPKPISGDPWKYDKGRPDLGLTGLSPGSQDTTHLCTADGRGNMVALTITLCGAFGSGVTIPGTGIIMNNGMYWFNPMPGSANSIQPGKRHVSNMAATLVLRNGQAVMVMGAAGGRRILTTVTELLTKTLDFKHGPDALFLPRFHVEDSEPIELEQSFYDETPLAYSLGRSLSKMGHTFTSLPSICIGCLIKRNAETGELQGAAEPRNRRDGSIAAY
jgi:gamma-glutamyltranspeptidase/glutathione hydrolase